MDQLVKQINEYFNECSEFPNDFVKASTNINEDFCLRIGSRDLQLDTNGQFIGCGSDLKLMKKYNIVEN